LVLLELLDAAHRNCRPEARAFRRREERWRRACQRSGQSSMVLWLLEN